MNDKAAIIGRRSKAEGAFWEETIEKACAYYSAAGLAEIQKTPEPMRPIRSLGNGKFIAHFSKMAQPDYKGTLKGGRAIVFEAKHTDKDRMLQSVISSEQEKELNKHLALGAECRVLVSFDFKRYFFIPWEVFRDMKARYGRKYIKPNDIPEYEIRYCGVLLFLGGMQEVNND